MEGRQLDYEGALAAIQGFLGKEVLVSVSPIDQAEITVVTFLGTLSRGIPNEGVYTDAGAPSGETVTFQVGDYRGGCGATFVLWRDHFSGGWAGPDADGFPTVILFDRGVGLGIRALGEK